MALSLYRARHHPLATAPDFSQPGTIRWRRHQTFSQPDNTHRRYAPVTTGMAHD
ncbi:hypothetical protein AAGR22_11455 [Erwinia sp. HDF1-3R]|uniref:hypothetical protein n=1 Tax=Erwinia sp. HDF1-3R TaxID=3141543 RepID=UPI0031F4FC92